MHVCMCVCMYVCMYACIHTHTVNIPTRFTPNTVITQATTAHLMELMQRQRFKIIGEKKKIIIISFKNAHLAFQAEPHPNCLSGTKQAKLKNKPTPQTNSGC